MPKRPGLFGLSVPRLARRRLSLLLGAIGIFALFSLLFTLPGSIPTTPSLSQSLSDHKISFPGLPGSLSSLSPFRPTAHAPPVQKNSTYEGSSWYSNWNWLSPFSSSITLDENRSLLPPLKERPPIYCYYDTSVQRDDTTKEAESELLLTWRRAWWAQGFRPVILSAAEAMNNPLYDELQRMEVEPTFKKDLMRWLAWENMGGGLLAHYRLFPMGDPHDTLLSFMRRGEYPTLTRWDGISGGLFAGPKSEITEILTQALRTKKTKGVKDVIGAVEAEAFEVDKSHAALAFYNTRTIEQNYNKVAEEMTANHASGLKNLNLLINAHLHSTWQKTFDKGIAVLKPLSQHTTIMVEPAFQLATTLATCPTSPIPPSCPPNLSKCTPCNPSKPMKITTPPTYRNTTGEFTIGTVPHPYTLQSLNSLRDTLDLPWIRAESLRDIWLYKLTKDLLGAGVSSSPRLLKFKEAVAGDFARYHSIWLTAERETPRDLGWWFGFEIPAATEPEESSESSATTASKSHKTQKTGSDGPAPSDDEFDLEPVLLEKARAMGKTKDKEQLRIRDAIEAWNLADTEAWKFTRAFLARSRVERLKWEEEESKYAEGVGSDRDSSKTSWAGRWKDDEDKS